MKVNHLQAQDNICQLAVSLMLFCIVSLVLLGCESNDFGGIDYRGPCTNSVHRYVPTLTNQIITIFLKDAQNED